MLNFVFFFLSHRYEFFENGVGLKYFQSIIQDGDFNIFNQYSDAIDRWMVTKTYNHPDYHSPFIAVVLYIPYLFFKVFSLSAVMSSELMYYQLYFLAAIAVVLVLKNPLFESVTEDKIYKFFFAGLILSTGAFWFIFFDPTEYSAVCLFFSSIVFYEIYKHIKDPIRSPWLLVLPLGFFWILKTDGVFYVAAVGLFFLITRRWRNLFFLLLAIGLFQAQLSLVNYIKLGTLDIKYYAVVFDHSYTWQYFFSTNGLFVKTPIFLVLFIAAFIELFKLKETGLRGMLYFSLFVILLKAFIMGFIITPIPPYLASRHSISDIPAWAFIAYLAYKRMPKIISMAFAVLIIFNFYHLYSVFLSYHLGDSFDYPFHSVLPWETATKNFHFFVQYLHSQFNSFSQNFKLIIQLSVCGSLFLTFLVIAQEKFQRFSKYGLGVLLIFLSLSFSYMNYQNNSANTLKLKAEGVFDKAVIAEGAALYYDEIFSIIDHNKKTHNYIQKPDMIEIEKYQQDFLQLTLQGIIYDPTEFTENLKNNIIRKSFWSAKP
jgi:hypothetical protein